MGGSSEGGPASTPSVASSWSRVAVAAAALLAFACCFTLAFAGSEDSPPPPPAIRGAASAAAGSGLPSGCGGHSGATVVDGAGGRRDEVEPPPLPFAPLDTPFAAALPRGRRTAGAPSLGSSSSLSSSSSGCLPSPPPDSRPPTAAAPTMRSVGAWVVTGTSPMVRASILTHLRMTLARKGSLQASLKGGEGKRGFIRGGSPVAPAAGGPWGRSVGRRTSCCMAPCRWDTLPFWTPSRSS